MFELPKDLNWDQDLGIIYQIINQWNAKLNFDKDYLYALIKILKILTWIKKIECNSLTFVFTFLVVV